MEKRYKIVGWYSQDGSNQHVVPFARVVEVLADGPDDAYAKGSRELDRLYLAENKSVDFLNWFIEELKP